jgi:tetratricopeptide (TPR) repeat protein
MDSGWIEACRKHQYSYVFVIIVIVSSFIGSLLLLTAMGVLSLQDKILSSLYACLIVLTLWLYNRFRLPRNRKGKLGIYVSITTEGNKERTRLHTDIVETVRDKISSMELSRVINVIELNNHQSTMVCKMVKAIKEHPKFKENGQSKLVTRLSKRLNANMIVTGSMSIRNNSSVFQIVTESILFHPSFSAEHRDTLRDGMDATWYKEQLVPTDGEIKGFKITSTTLLIHLLYMIGVTASLYNDVKLSTDLLDAIFRYNLLNEVSNEIAPKVLKTITDKLLRGYTLLSEHYLAKKDGDLTLKYIERMALLGKSYDYYLIKAIYHFSIQNNLKTALASINKASKLAGSDKRWLYSLGFLQFNAKEYEQALQTYTRIARSTFPNEDKVIDQVYAFIVDYINENPDRLDYKFVLGFITYKKSHNVPLAYKLFDEFVNSNVVKDKIVIDRANVYMGEMSKSLHFTQ